VDVKCQADERKEEDAFHAGKNSAVGVASGRCFCGSITDVIAYLAPEGFVEELVTELDDVAAVHGRLVLVDGPQRPAVWAANVWHVPVLFRINSIADAARKLRAIQRDWTLYSFQLHRRAQLIAAQLPSVAVKPLAFPATPPSRPIGSWTLLDEQTVLASARCSSPWPNGEIEFIEDHAAPPSRAYLKLWELFSRLQVWPKAGECCIDLGACPGGWTWVLHNLGARVLAVDKAPLAAGAAKLPGVEFRRESAFGVQPEPVDWLFSDVICYPKRLLELVRRWLPAARNMVCTVKFQGKMECAVVREFAAIPGSQLIHLHHNRHELTWFRLAVAI
jgi:23S rRNA (cytidine2498-2'-O)-methyltransferase